MLSTWEWWEIFLQIFQQLLDEYCFADAKVIHIKMWENLNICATNTKQFFMDAQITNMSYKDYMHLKECIHILTLFMISPDIFSQEKKLLGPKLHDLYCQ